MELPSNKLIEAVLKFKNIKVTSELEGKYDPCILIQYENADKTLEYSGGVLLLNIYELMHLMKEWGWKQHHVRLSSGRRYGTGIEEHNCCIDVYNPHKFYNDENLKNLLAPTEFEAVTKACEWILKQNG